MLRKIAQIRLNAHALNRKKRLSHGTTMTVASAVHGVSPTRGVSAASGTAETSILDNGATILRLTPMATIYETLRADIITAVKARDTATATTLRSCDAAIQRASMDQAKPIDDTLVLVTLRKTVKNLNDAIIEFEKGGRADLVTANQTELRLIEKYLPKGLDAAKVEALVAAAIAETGASSKKDMGKVIGALKKSPEAALIDFGAVSKIVQAKLP